MRGSASLDTSFVFLMTACPGEHRGVSLQEVQPGQGLAFVRGEAPRHDEVFAELAEAVAQKMRDMEARRRAAAQNLRRELALVVGTEDADAVMNGCVPEAIYSTAADSTELALVAAKDDRPDDSGAAAAARGFPRASLPRTFRRRRRRRHRARFPCVRLV